MYVYKDIYIHIIKNSIYVCTYYYQYMHACMNNNTSIYFFIQLQKDGYQLYWCDYLSNMDAINKGAHGYGAYLVNAILDKYYHENMNLEEALVIFKKCFEELKKRFLLTQINYELRIMSNNKIETQYVNI